MTDTMKPYKLGDFIRIQHGYPFKSEFFADSGDLQTTSLGSFYERGGFKYPNKGKEKFTTEKCPQEYHLKKGDMIIAMTEQVRGLLGATAWIPEDDTWLLNQRCGLLTCYNSNVEVDRIFVYYLFSTKNVREQISRPAQGTKQRNTSPESIYDVKVWLPSLSQQQAIATILDNIDRKISLNNSINAEFEKAAKLLYNYWFVQFDFPNAEGKPYRSSGGKMVYNEQLERRIPKGWKVDKLENKLNMQRGFEPGSGAYSEVATEMETVPFIRVSDLGSKPALYISQEAANGNCCVPTDVLVSFDGSVGKMAIAMEGAYSSGIRKITPKDDGYSDALIYFIFQSEEIQKTIAKYAVGSIILHAAGAIEHLMFPYEEAVAKTFIAKVEPIYKKIVANRQQNKELAALRDFLLPLLMNGQVTVAASEAVTELGTILLSTRSIGNE
jgi:type I restriction enzyme S subunit